MIYTIKMKIKELSADIVDFQRQYNNVIRWSYNRAMDGVGKYAIFDLIKDNALNHVELLDNSWMREAVKVGSAAAKSSKELGTVSVFQSRANKRRRNGTTTREEFLKEKTKSLMPITCEGSKADPCGNRKFRFDAENLSGWVKLGKEKVTFSCENIGVKRQRELISYMQMAEEGLIGVTCKIRPRNFYICIDTDDLVKEEYSKIEGRTLALDMNPNYIGLSIVDTDETIMLKRVYDLKRLPKKKNKHDHELTQIAIGIANLCKHYGVSLVGFEKLKIKSGNKKKGKKYNKIVNNEWRRERFVNSLTKHLSLIDCPYKEIVAAYSSFIGCISYPDDTDSVAASIELNRRLRLYYAMHVLKCRPVSDIIYPRLDLPLMNRWKKDLEVSGEYSDWKAFYQACKRAKHSYRRLFPQWLVDIGLKENRFGTSDNSKVGVLTLCCNEKTYFN